jgi:hypothetical protein
VTEPVPPRTVGGALLDRLSRRWHDLAGARREAVRQQGETGRLHRETKRKLLEGRPEISQEQLDAELAEVSRELRATLEPRAP